MKDQAETLSDGRNGNMKNLFDKSNFVFSTLDPKQRRQSLILSILMMVLFVFSSFTFFNMLYAFADAVGSIVSGSADVAIKDLLRSVPLFLSFFMSLWTLLLLHASFRRVNDERWHKSLFKDAICIIAFAGLNILYVIVGLIIGKYSSLVEGSPSPLFPLDSIIYSLVFIAIGVLVILYVKKYEEKLPYLVPARGEIVKKARGLYCTFMTFWMLIALFGFSAGLYSIFIYDFLHGYAFYGIAVILIYCLSPVLLGLWEFYYNELIEEKKKELLLPISLISLGVSVLFTVLYVIALSTNMDAPSNAGFGMFPVAFAASVNIATLIVVFTPLIVSVTALIKGLLKRKKQ